MPDTNYARLPHSDGIFESVYFVLMMRIFVSAVCSLICSQYFSITGPAAVTVITMYVTLSHPVLSCLIVVVTTTSI